MSLVAVSSYSFHRLVKAGESSLADAPRLAREASADAVEFALGGSLSLPLSVSMARDLAVAAASAGMPVTGVCIAAELLRGSAIEQSRARDSVLRQLDAAATLGVRRFRHDATLGPDNGDSSDAAFDEALVVLAPACRAIAEHAATLGIASSVENHGRFIQHADRVARLVEQVGHPSFGVTLDIGNSLFAAQDPVRAAERLAPWAITVHVKDFEIHPRRTGREAEEGVWETYPGGPLVRGSVIGEGNLDVRGCLDAVLRAGFAGPFVVEFEGPLGDPRDAARKGVEHVREVLR